MLFLLQTSILRAYRSAIRSTRPLPDSQTRRETLDFFRGELDRLRNITDINILKSNLSTFQRTTKSMLPSLGLTGLSGSGSKLVGQRRS
ncbi:hypothetical protein M231_03248 [Tremella mesenterica]|uniref:Uncharacterized protein n=1 Tax=Tremella mesenterica TaxID=5217 RepID=A0A4Q1BNG7_TREME|nr:hypothetical protein M231_03248 [Tremella mesenterica]